MQKISTILLLLTLPGATMLHLMLEDNGLLSREIWANGGLHSTNVMIYLRLKGGYDLGSRFQLEASVGRDDELMLRRATKFIQALSSDASISDSLKYAYASQFKAVVDSLSRRADCIQTCKHPSCRFFGGHTAAIPPRPHPPTPLGFLIATSLDPACFRLSFFW